MYSYLNDPDFLRALDKENLKTHYVRVDVYKLDILTGRRIPVSIIGQVIGGSLTINGNSSIRRAGNISFVADDKNNDAVKLKELLHINQQIKIFIGLKNNIDRIKYVDEILWFNQGYFYIAQPTITHSMDGVTVSLQLKDKMCMLNGELGGNLPTSITFDSYDQIIGSEEIEYETTVIAALPEKPNNRTVYVFKKKGESDSKAVYKMWNIDEGWYDAKKKDIGQTVSIKQRIFDIIQTLVCNFGGEDINKIIINDIPLELKSEVRYVGDGSLYYNSNTGEYTLNEKKAVTNSWQAFKYNESCGYKYTDFTYPGELVSAIGDNICSVLDKIKSNLGNYEYFYDVDGNFVFQEIRNYLNTSYNPFEEVDRDFVPQDGIYNPNIINEKTYYLMNLSAGTESVYTFNEGSTLINSYTNNPVYTSIKNDFHIWGADNDKNVIHYHLVIKDKPQKDTYKDGELQYRTRKVIKIKDSTRIRLPEGAEVGEDYTPTDWRAELYLRGLEKQAIGNRPDIYEQEILDLFDSIYDMQKQDFFEEKYKNPNSLKYWIDYIDPTVLRNISVDTIGSKIKSYQQDNINKLYNKLPPNVVVIKQLVYDAAGVQERNSIWDKCRLEGQNVTQAPNIIYNKMAIGVSGYSADEVARDLIYQSTDAIASISISSIPIYYLEPNTRITVEDASSQIYGDYLIKTISLPLDGKGNMSISAAKILTKL